MSSLYIYVCMYIYIYLKMVILCTVYYDVLFCDSGHSLDPRIVFNSVAFRCKQTHLGQEVDVIYNIYP